MRAMHGFVVYIFTKVWCRAPHVEYSIELFKGLPTLYTIMDELYRADLAGIEKGAGAFFYSHVNQIFMEFKKLSTEDIQVYRQMFIDNNSIKELCEGKKQPTHYNIKASQSALMQLIERFFSNIYSCGFFGLSIVKKHIGSDLKGHYESFARLNSMPCCPFCGLIPMDSEFDPTREAYDHYLPASKYPFNSVNLRNLAPSCYKCNSQNKGAKDPLQDDKENEKKAFYPYTADSYPIKISINFLSNSQITTEQKYIHIDLECPGYEEEVQTWDRLFKIRERYVAKCLSASGATYWLQRVFDESNNYQQNVAIQELEQYKKFPWHDVNFLKLSFLEACNTAGIFQEQKQDFLELNRGDIFNKK